MAAIYGMQHLTAFLDSAAEVGIMAHVELRELQAVIASFKAAGKFPLLNVDTCEGLAQDKAAIDYLVAIGVPALVSTRVATLVRANRAGMITMQKVFVTDRTTWPRSLKALEQSEPNLVQLMPAPMLTQLQQADRAVLPPIVASGFVCNEDDARAALAAGAVALSSSEQRLWNLPTGAISAP
ncbi:GlpP family transcriptional regulator [Herbaspirillum sp. GW103]|uniref:glycerol-3-phosphate responsive antiterminator n=1 Tax=unclassified Herbaspirillum TaxID=2624150 RepID=UPI00025E45A5|nr:MULTISPECIES: glycerol-3-phosphate responsive antiterminator [unclassified Herbaspirillum]EIJ47844.1 GlpP family transcriptional regulator [Herbaspirillum sp. GW103]MCI1005841.1 glycerol-3-phosphate responsive antiterminator [Herbaspirillum sp. C7C8]NUT61865.1 glycerol-3-phosphate responsive antiterminator [Herbaspirillum sp. C9C3]